MSKLKNRLLQMQYKLPKPKKKQNIVSTLIRLEADLKRIFK